MKRFIFLFSVLAALLLGVTACHDAKPEFKFSLELTGNVSDASTSVYGDFSAKVFNDQADVLLADSEASIHSLGAPEGRKADTWLESYMKENVLDDLDATDYNIYVKGYVKEVRTGLLFSVDKRFSNNN